MRGHSMKYEVTYRMNNYGELVILDYIDSSNVVVKFTRTGHITKTEAGRILKGMVKDVMLPFVCGVGYMGVGTHRANVDGKRNKAYSAWASILARCYDKITQEKLPTYRGCILHEDWHNFQNFADWFESNYVLGWQIDKDYLVKDNKIYSPDTCIFIPRKLNSFILDGRGKRGKSPIGVHYWQSTGKYRAQCNDGSGVQKYLGYYDSEEEAHLVWKRFKLSCAYALRGEMDSIDKRLYPRAVEIIGCML